MPCQAVLRVSEWRSLKHEDVALEGLSLLATTLHNLREPLSKSRGYVHFAEIHKSPRQRAPFRDGLPWRR